jgi:hypothetical protein
MNTRYSIHHQGRCIRTGICAEGDVALQWVPEGGEIRTGESAQSEPDPLPQVATTFRRQDTDVILARLTEAETVALFSSADPRVKALIAKATATGGIRDDDPRFPQARTLLAALGIIAFGRWDDFFQP